MDSDLRVETKQLVTRILLVVAIVLFLVAFSRGSEPPVAALPPVAQVTADPKPACVRVSWGQYSASGTCIACEGDTALVLTCNHLFYEQPHPGAKFERGAYPLAATVTAGGKTYKATAIDGDAHADLALVVVSASLPSVELAPTLPTVGSTVRHFGNGSGGGSGKVLDAPLGVSRPSMQFLYEAVSDSGDSGAGVFDAAGRLVAVHCGRDGVGKSAPARGTPVTSVRVVVKQSAPVLFPRLRARLGARGEVTPVESVPPKAAVPKVEPKKVDPPKKTEAPKSPAPVAVVPSVTVGVGVSNCPGGVCPLPSARRGLLGRRW